MQKVIFTNSRGQVIELFRPPFFLEKIEGLGGVPADVQIQKAPFQDGSTLIDIVLQERPITIEAALIGEGAPDVQRKRQYFSQIFNPKLGLGVLRYENDAGKWEIEAAADSAPIYPSGSGNNGPTFQKTLLHLICPNPYWKDIDDTEASLTAWIGKFEFPFEFPVEFGERANRASISNEGDESTPVILNFYGPATNPAVTNETTGETIKVNRPLVAGDILEVNTAFGQKTVEIVKPDGSRQNVFNYIDLDSDFFQIVPGKNEISFSSDDVVGNGSVSIKYKKRYLGV